MADIGALAGAAPVDSKVDQPATDASNAPAIKGKQDDAPEAPAIVSPPATEPDHGGVDELEDTNAPPASSQPAESETKPAEVAPEQKQPVTQVKFVPISADAPGYKLATNEPTSEVQLAGDTDASAPMSSSSTVPKPATVEDAPLEESPQPLPVPTQDTVEGPKAGEKRKVDDSDLSATTNGDIRDDTTASTEENIADSQELVAKKARTNGGPSGRRASRSMSDKRKKEPAPVGQTHRKTRSQGPVETMSL